MIARFNEFFACPWFCWASSPHSWWLRSPAFPADPAYQVTCLLISCGSCCLKGQCHEIVIPATTDLGPTPLHEAEDLCIGLLSILHGRPGK